MTDATHEEPQAGTLAGTVLLVAFEGWTDACEATSVALRHMRGLGAYERAAKFSGERYLDYQFTRPRVRSGKGGKRKIVFPKIQMLRQVDAPLTGGPVTAVHLLTGAEPARKWKTFAKEAVRAALSLDVDTIVFLGSMLADVPHTRPVPVYATSEDAQLRQELDVERSTYEGPIGIASVMAARAAEFGIPSVSLWASVPHYAHNVPSPAAALALLERFSELSAVWTDPDGLTESATRWGQTLDAMTEDDEDMQAYIQRLEQARDAVDAPEATGDAIAEEFERYLRGNGDGKDGGPAQGPNAG